MNNLKFRIWDVRNKNWLTYKGDEDHLINCNGNLFWVYDWESDFHGTEGINKTKLDKKNYVIQFYTGLKDLNKKEIYDGDLIKGNGYGPYRVFWDEQIGGWCSCCYSDAELISSYKMIEIVGHIFDGTKYKGVL